MEDIKTVDMVRKIRDRQYTLTKDMAPDELIQFYRNKAEAANNEALTDSGKKTDFLKKTEML